MSNGIILDYQNPENRKIPATEEDFSLWAEAALSFARKQSTANSPEQAFDMTIRIVDIDEGRQLNLTYRQKDYATNVLSFPFEAPEEVDINLLGDIIICAPVVANEAHEQHKSERSHWAHLTIHGTLHLLGFDHIDPEEADTMEAIEVNAMTSLGFSDPYIDQTTDA